MKELFEIQNLKNDIEMAVLCFIEKSQDIGNGPDDYETELLSVLSNCGLNFSR